VKGKGGREGEWGGGREREGGVGAGRVSRPPSRRSRKMTSQVSYAANPARSWSTCVSSTRNTRFFS